MPKFKALELLKESLGSSLTANKDGLVSTLIDLQTKEKIASEVKIEDIFIESFEELDVSKLKKITIVVDGVPEDFLKTRWPNALDKIEALYLEGKKLLNDLYDTYESSVAIPEPDAELAKILGNLEIEIDTKIDVTDMVIKSSNYIAWKKKLEQHL